MKFLNQIHNIRPYISKKSVGIGQSELGEGIHFKSGNRERKKPMKVHYDEEVDALYLKLGDQKPDGVIEISEGVNIDTTTDGKLTGIEILKASKKINIDTILSYTLELDQGILKKKFA